MLGQTLDLGRRQLLSFHNSLTQLLVVIAKDGKGQSLGIVTQKIPVAGATGVIDGSMAPMVLCLGRGGLAGFQVGAVHIGKAVHLRSTLAEANHLVQRGQIFRILDRFFGAAQNGLRRKSLQRFHPQAFRLIDRGDIAKSAVVLIMVIDAKQGEYLIDGINEFGAGGRWSLFVTLRGLALRRPSCGR